MKADIRRKSMAVAIIAILVAAIVSLGIVFSGKANADTSNDNIGLTYYYSKLKHNERAQRIYNAFDALYKDGAFKKGKIDYNLVENNVVVEEDVKNYVMGSGTAFPIAFGAARDSFLADHPDLFYADVYGVSVSAGMQGGKYVAFMDTSRTSSLYIGNLDTEAKVNAAVTEYETKLNAIVTEAKTKTGDKARIEFVNQYIAEHTEYSFCTRVENGKTVTDPEAAYINTAYGAIVNGKAICGGYTKAFKAVMDRLDIPCVYVQGYGKGYGKDSFEAHAWNAVQLEGQWYAVDVTWNDTASKLDKYMLLGEVELSKDHIEDGAISMSGYELDYPALKPYNYGIDSDENGMDIKGELKEDNGSKWLELSVSYENKGAGKLLDDGKHLAFRYGSNQGDGTIFWTPWFDFVQSAEDFGFEYDDAKSTIPLHAGIEMVQCALVDIAPDTGYFYGEDTLTEDNFIVQPSVPYQNEAYGEYIPSPYANKVTPSNTGSLNVNNTYDMKFEYDEKLKLAEGKTKEDVKLYITTTRGNDTINDCIVVEDFKWDENKTVTFKFTPSKMFIHMYATYSMYVTNLVGDKSEKIPDPVSFKFEGKTTVCNKIFDDGRLYMNVYGSPQMLDTSDLSMSDFKDENGNYYAESQRSQLILVADKPTPKEEKEMMDSLTEKTELKNTDIVTSATYEISLNICGMIKSIPKGTYMQVAFGFPEGFSPDDAGTTFKIYHYRKEGGKIVGVDEIPVIVTEYGLIAKVASFSPFTVVQVKKSAVAASDKKYVYASVSGNGKITNSGINEVEGASIAYTIAADAGYTVGSVILNGKPLAADKYDGGTVTLQKTELSEGNTLEVTFVTTSSAQSYKDLGVEIIQPDRMIVSAQDITQSFQGEDNPGDGDNQASNVPSGSSNDNGGLGGGAIALICIAVIAVVAGCAVALILIFKKKKEKK